jgi:hypothetical protein
MTSNRLPQMMHFGASSILMPTLIHTGRPDGHPDYFKRG